MKDLIVCGPKLLNCCKKGFGEFFFEKAGEIGDKIFQIDGLTEEVETYGQVKTRTTRLALGLKQLGVRGKDVVFLCCYNGIDNIIPVLATLYLGGCVSSGDPRQTADDTRHLIEQVEPKVIFVGEHSVDTIEKALEGSSLRPRIIVMGNSDEYLTMRKLEAPSPEEADFKPVGQSESDVAFILFSSGTTSAQKGIYISNKYALNGGNLWLESKNLIPGVIMHFSSFYWITAVLLTSACMITGTAKVVGDEEIPGERFLYLVDKYKITYCFGVNTFTYKLTNLDEKTVKKYNTSSWLSFSIGGAVVQPDQIQKLRDILPHTKVTMAYGSTECNLLTSFDLDDEKAYKTKLRSSGTLVPGAQLKVVDIETGKLLGPNQKGEIRARSQFAMSGYHKFEDPDVFDEDGFVKMGDLGYYDEDNYIYVLGRIKEMFKYQSFQILPGAIEKVLLAHPDVEEGVVFGVPHPVDNHHPGAAVVLKHNADVTAEELIDYCNSRVADYRKLRAGLVILDKLTKTPTGKVQRRLIRDNFIKMK